MASIQVVIGLILIMLFYSLLASIIMELISGFFSLRGKHLHRALKNMLSSSDRNEELFGEFIRNPLYLQLSGRATGKKSAPSYISARSFREILLTTIEKRLGSGDLMQKLNDLPDQNLKEVLAHFLKESNFDVQTFQAKVEGWYDEVMDRAKGWYARNVQKILLMLGLVIAALFNVDAIQVYENLLNTSQADLDELTALAEQVRNQQTTTEVANGGSTLENEIYLLIEQNLDKIENPLGIGWSGFQPTDDILFWVLKVCGWIITAICISKGSPFWFDLLNKVISFRSAGNRPLSMAADQKKTAEQSSSSSVININDRQEKEVLVKPVG